MKKIFVACILSLVMHSVHADAYSVYSLYKGNTHQFIERVFVTEIDNELRGFKMRAARFIGAIFGIATGAAGGVALGDLTDGFTENMLFQEHRGLKKDVSLAKDVVLITGGAVIAPMVLYKGVSYFLKKHVYKKVLMDFIEKKELYKDSTPVEIWELMNSLNPEVEDFDAIAVVEAIRENVYRELTPKYIHRLKVFDAPSQKERSTISRSLTLRIAIITGLIITGGVLVGERV